MTEPALLATPPPQPPALLSRRRILLVLELVVVLLVLLLPLSVWPRAATPPGVDLPPLPWWGAWSDLVLEGPDAAEWAVNASRMADGDFAALDRHRMPSWLLATAVLVRSGMEVVAAGHLLNRGMFLAAALSSYALGRLVGGRLAGLLAASMVVAHPHLALGVQRIGIDATIEAMLPAAMAAAFLPRVRWWLGLPAGLFLGWVLFLHHTTVPYFVPAVLLALLVGQPGWRRFAGAALVLGGAGAVLGILLQFHPLPGWREIAFDVSEGMNPGTNAAPGPNPADRVVDSLQTSWRRGLPGAYALVWEQMWGWLVPARVLLPFLTIGIVAPFVRPPPVLAPVAPAPPRPTGLRAFAVELASNSAQGLVLLSCLAPIPFLAAAGAPDRYGSNLFPFAAVLIGRGLASVGFALQRLAVAVNPLLPRGLVGAALGVTVLVLTSQKIERRGLTRAPMADEVLGFYLLGREMERLFPPGTAVACPVTESLMQAGLDPCRDPVCPRTTDDLAVVGCARILASHCAVDGLFGYVSLPGHENYDPNAPGRPALDVWIADRAAPDAVVSSGTFSASIYRFPVSLIPP